MNSHIITQIIMDSDYFRMLFYKKNDSDIERIDSEYNYIEEEYNYIK